MTRPIAISEDPVLLEVIRYRLEGIANEMESTLVRSAFSTIVKEAMDASSSLFTAAGETLAQAIAIPMHLSTLAPMVRKILEKFPRGQMKDGDIFILNDPYSGGTHLPDIAVVMPVFSAGRVIAISATLTHHQDIGGMAPGSTPTNAIEIFQEGIRIPPIQLASAGTMSTAVLDLLQMNSRVPAIFTGDLNAQIAACTIGSRRIQELVQAYGADFLETKFRHLLDNSERMTRDALKSVREGTYRYIDFLDNDGVELDKRIRIEVAVTVRDGTMTCDFTGTSAQVKGPFNMVPSGTHAAACFAVRVLTDPDIPTNEGCFRPIRLVIAKGSLLDPLEPAPVGCRALTAKRVAGCILGALRDAVPERLPADASGELVTIRFGGARENGTRFVTTQHVVGGSGAGPAKDGVDVIQTDLTNGMCVPAEAMEQDYPIRVHRVELLRDSGGAGKTRGGLGAIHEYEMLANNIVITYRGERHYVQSSGAAGGHAGGLAQATVRRANGELLEIPSKIVIALNRGDQLIVKTAGGGGHGLPTERDRALVAADVANRKVTTRAASELYGWIEVAQPHAVEHQTEPEILHQH